MPTPPQRTVIRYFGDYVLMGEIATGGMGVVHRARQVSLNRNVALKMIHPGKLDRPDSLRRFRNEGEAMAALRHEHIVHIHEIGEHEGRHYFSMELVEGENLADLIDRSSRRKEAQNSEVRNPKSEIDQSLLTSAATRRGSPSPGGEGRGEGESRSPRPSDGRGVRGEGQQLSDLPFGSLPWQRAAAALLAKVARAVHYAHQRGVLHRDLKPSNILVDESGEPHLTDFGLAKLLESDSDLTQSQDVMGTPNYMAPEQAAGKNSEVTTATDVYGLGAILFAALTGRPPCVGESAAQFLLQLAQSDPPRPRSLNPQVDRDLETICLKCLEKHPRRRYDSSAALAEDLERWLAGEPIVARPVGAWERAWKWVRRRPMIAGLSAAVVLSVLLGLSGFTWQWRQKMEAIRLRFEGISSTRLQLTELLLRDGDTRAALRELARQGREDPLDSRNAHRLWTVLDNRNWPLPQEQFAVPGAVGAVRWHPNGRTMAVLSGAGTDRKKVEVTLWESATGQRLAGPQPLGRLPGNLEFSPDGRRLFTLFHGEARLWDGSQLTTSAAPLATNLPSVDFAWHPDSRRVLLPATNGVALLDVPQAQPSPAIPADPRFSLPAYAVALAFRADGQWFAASDAGGRVRVWETDSARLVVELPRQPAPAAGVAFSTNGQRCVTMLVNRECVLWELPAGREIKRFPARTATFDATGQRLLLSGTNDDVTLADATNGSVLRVWTNTATMYPHGFSPDGQALVLIRDSRPQWISIADGTLLGEPLPYSKVPEVTQFSPDGSVLAVGTAAGDVALWRRPHATPAVQLAKSARRFAISADGAWLAIAQDSEVRLLDSAERTMRTLVVTGTVTAVDFDANATLVAAGTDSGRIFLWRIVDGAERLSVGLGTNKVWFVRLSPNGRVLAGLTFDGWLQQWDARTGQALTPPLDLYANGPRGWDGRQPFELRFSPDGRTLVAACYNGTALAFETATANRRFVLPHTDAPVADLRFSHDGRRIATVAFDGFARIWDARTGRQIGEKLYHDGHVYSVDFSPDDRLLLTASKDGKARVWDAATGRLLATAIGHAGSLREARFAPDGARFATGGRDGTVRVWDTASGLPLDDPLPVPTKNPCRVAWRSEDTLLAGGTGTPLTRRSTPRPTVPVPAWVPALAEALSGMTTNRSAAPDLLRLRDQILNQRVSNFWSDWAKRFFQAETASQR